MVTIVPRDPNRIPGLAAANTVTGAALSISGFLLGGTVGALAVAIVDGTGAQITASNPLPVTGSFTPSGTQDVNITKIGGNSVTTTIPVSGTVAFSNSTIAVTNTGTFAVQATLAAETTKVIGTVNQGTSPWVVSGTVTITPSGTQDVSLTKINGNAAITAGVNGTLAIGGNVATNVAIGTNPINLGAQGVSSENSAVTTSRMVQLVADLVGKLIVLPYANPENFVSGAITSAMAATTSTSLVAAPAGSLRNYITTVIVSNAHATVGTDMILQDGSGGTTLATIPAASGYGGAVVTFPTPLRQPTAATALYIQNVTTGASTKATAFGYKGL